MLDPIVLVWILAIAAEGSTAAVIYARREVKAYPLFFSYLLFLCLKSVSLFTMWLLGMRYTYFIAYAIGTGLSALLLLAVVGEVLIAVFRPFASLPRHTGWFVCAALFLGGLTAAFSPHKHLNELYATSSFIAQAGSRLTLISFAGMLLLSYVFGLPWRRRVSGIALGLLIEVGGEASISAVSVICGLSVAHIADWAHMTFFLLANAVWILTFMLRDSKTYTLNDEQMKRLGDLENTLLQSIALLRSSKYQTSTNRDHCGD